MKSSLLFSSNKYCILLKQVPDLEEKVASVGSISTIEEIINAKKLFGHAQL